VVPEVDVDPEVEVDPDEVEADAVVPPVVDADPGSVCALTPLSTPTPAIALKATPAVSRFSIRFAASRARILVVFAIVFSMVLRLAGAA
jgi:hypothetical protein